MTPAVMKNAMKKDKDNNKSVAKESYNDESKSEEIDTKVKKMAVSEIFESKITEKPQIERKKEEVYFVKKAKNYDSENIENGLDLSNIMCPLENQSQSSITMQEILKDVSNKFIKTSPTNATNHKVPVLSSSSDENNFDSTKFNQKSVHFNNEISTKTSSLIPKGQSINMQSINMQSNKTEFGNLTDQNYLLAPTRDEFSGQETKN